MSKAFIPMRQSIENDIRLTKKYMCSSCTFFVEGKCALNRNVENCRRKGLKNKQ